MLETNEVLLSCLLSAIKLLPLWTKFDVSDLIPAPVPTTCSQLALVLDLLLSCLSAKLEKNNPSEKQMAVSLAVLLICMLKGRVVGCTFTAGNLTSGVSLAYCCAESPKPMRQHWLGSAGDLVLTLHCLLLFLHHSGKHLGGNSSDLLVQHQLQGLLWWWLNDKPRAELVLNGVCVCVWTHCFSPYPKPGIHSYFKAFCELLTGRNTKPFQSPLSPNQDLTRRWTGSNHRGQMLTVTNVC